MRKKVLIAMLCLLVGIVGVVSLPRIAQADATPVESYVISQLVVEINRVVTILNGVLDSNNALTGDITTDDITAAGADTASLDFNYPASTNAQMATVTHKSATTVANMDDNDYVRYILLNAYNSATAAVNYAYIDAIADDVTTATEDGSIDFVAEVNSTATTLLSLNASGATVTALNTGTGEATVDGKYAVTGGDATTGLMIQKAAITSSTNVLQTNSFAVAFGAAPVVVCTYTENPGDVQPINIESTTTTNFVARVTADKNFAYIAVGTRP